MSGQTTDILSGNIIEDDNRLTLRQLCEACSVRADYIIELVDEGFIEPTGVSRSHWCFNGVAIQRVQKAWRLQRDLGLNLAGAALALELMEEIERLRAQPGRA